MKNESLPRHAAALLRSKMNELSAQRATIGLDGFVDEIVSVVDKRESTKKFTRIATLSAFGERINRAAGKSSNAELVVTRVKLGGNGPIMANALACFGAQVTYIGNLGYPNLHPAFEEFATQAQVFSIAEPGHTDALEFDDGKLMLGKVTSLNDITWDNMMARVGRDELVESFTRADLIGLQNWTMIPFMTNIWQHVLDDVCPKLPSRDMRPVFFFDLADPERRDPGDIRAAIELIGKFQQHFDTYLGLNEKESFEIGHVFGYSGATEGAKAVEAVGSFIQKNIQISAVVVHPRAYAAAASAIGVAMVEGPFTKKPLISTGAGDHFNAGFCLGKLIRADDEVSLQLGVGTSGYYVRTGKSPSAGELAEFLHSL